MANTKISALTSSTTPLAGTEVLPIVQSGATVKVAVSDVTAGRVVSMSGLGIGTASPSESAQINNGRFRFLESGQRQYNIGITSGTSDFAIADATFSYTPFTVSGTGNVIANTGNFVPGTAAKGVNFTANTPAAGMTSQLLNWYEQGTWTPSLVPGTSGSISLSTANGKYTRIGNMVTVVAVVESNGVTAPVGELRLSGLPFTVASVGGGSFAPFAYGLVATAITSLVGNPSATKTYAVISKYAAGGVSNLAGDVQNGTGMYISFSYFV